VESIAKYLKKAAILTAIAALLTISCGTTNGENTVFSEFLPETEVLDAGVMEIYDFGKVLLHAYQTNDPMKDECFILETDHELISIETPAFSRNIREYADYITALGKPLNHLIMVNHGNGGKVLNAKHVYTTAKTRAAFQEGGAIKAMIDNFVKVFGPEFDHDIPVVTDILAAGPVTIGGVAFNVVETKEGFDLEIPIINAVYTHMAGARTHNIFNNTAQVEDMLQKMKDFRTKRFALILTSHEVPEFYSAIHEKIRYLEQTQAIIASSGTRDEFIAAMKTAFPEYSGENYLEMSATALFPQ
jgi:hypothetical protein